jgi:hypothetical protein
VWHKDNVSPCGHQAPDLASAIIVSLAGVHRQQRFEVALIFVLRCAAGDTLGTSAAHTAEVG